MQRRLYGTSTGSLYLDVNLKSQNGQTSETRGKLKMNQKCYWNSNNSVINQECLAYGSVAILFGSKYSIFLKWIDRQLVL